MIVRNRAAAGPFITKDGSIIRSLLDRANAPVSAQSLAEATLPPGARTETHHHRTSEEFYYVLEGSGLMGIDGERRPIGVGDAVLIPPGARHTLTNTGDLPLVILCCCAPPYAHDDTYLEE